MSIYLTSRTPWTDSFKSQVDEVSGAMFMISLNGEDMRLLEGPDCLTDHHAGECHDITTETFIIHYYYKVQANRRPFLLRGCALLRRFLM